MSELGEVEGDACGLAGCGGILVRQGEDCYCRHTSPPCGSCMDAVFACDQCGRDTAEPT